MNNNPRKNNSDSVERDSTNNRLERNSSIPDDLPDSDKDKRELETEETLIDLPDVKDIPGQEFVNTPPVGSIGDTTIASDDEEGISVFDKDDSEDLVMGTPGDVSRGEREALEDITYMPTTDEDNLHAAKMDDADFQNERLDEKGFGDRRLGGSPSEPRSPGEP